VFILFVEDRRVSMQGVTGNRRWTRQHRCPICGGCDADERGKEKRCHGFMSADGAFIHCSREELAGGIRMSPKSETYAHQREGRCRCGTMHNEPAEPPRREREVNEQGAVELGPIVAEYLYCDERRNVLFRVTRHEPKTFRQWRPGGRNGWTMGIGEIRRVLYRLPELLAADPGEPVYIVEGEKDVDALRALGVEATCNPMGAGKWDHVAELARSVLAGRHVVIIVDKDGKGRGHATQIAIALSRYAASIRRLEMPGDNVKDAADWIAAGGTGEQLEELRAAAPPGVDIGGASVGLGSSEDRVPPSGDSDAPPAHEPSTCAPASGRPFWRTWSECIDEIYQRKDEPWIEIRIGAAVVAVCRNGSFAPLIAPSGAGKSTLALQMLVDHALNRGPAIYLTYELDGDEAVARALGQLCTYSWAGVLRGEVPRDRVPPVDRLRILERDDATLENLAVLVPQLRVQYPGEPVFVVVDYLQAKPAPPGKERGYAANVSADLRRAAKAYRVVLIGVSQASTANAMKMRAGELLGIDSASTGAETAQIERDAYVILTLGDRRKVDPETVAWRLSVAKYRLGEPDVVYELHYRGRIGVWEVVGEPVTAATVREERDSEARAKRIAELKRSIYAFVDASPCPMSKQNIIDASTGKESLINETIKELIKEQLLAHVAEKRGGFALIWSQRRISESQSQAQGEQAP
jgi:5S rRNA maturation endonuclease (ribonuclease M5)